MTKRYSYSPGGRRTVRENEPGDFAALSGWGCQSLKEPATRASWALGTWMVNATLRRFTAAGLISLLIPVAGSGAVAAALAGDFFTAEDLDLDTGGDAGAVCFDMGG